MIPESEIARIRETVCCVDVLHERGHELRRVGREFVGLCPYHSERTPSFYVDPAKNVFLCRGSCGAHGDVITLVMMLDGLSFVDAARKLGANGTAEGARRKKPRPFGPSHEERLAAAARERLAGILEAHACDPEPDFFHESPIRLEWPPKEDAAHFLEIFPPGSIVWTGEPRDSGMPDKAKHFRPVDQVIAEGPQGSRIAPGVFKPESFSRSQERLDGPAPFIIIECDDLLGRKPETAEERARNQALNGALIRWFRDDAGLHLAAIIDTGGKSLHAWFRRPPDKVLRDLAAILDAFHIDKAGLNAAQPFRLPGFPHEKTGAVSKLLYLDTLT